VRFAIEYQGRLIGGAGFYRRPSGAAELGFWLGRAWWGQGLATEAAQAVVQYGFNKKRLPGYSSAHFIDNPASGGVLAKLGFEKVGRGRIGCVARGYDVEAITYWLDRKRAAMLVPQTVMRVPERPRWRAFLAGLKARA
jgi:RimJ/RimL family protein N-acetyltransferase